MLRRGQIPYVGFEVFTAVTMKNAVFWGVAPCKCGRLNRRFGGSYRLLQLPAHAGSSLADFSTLKMEAIRSSKTSVQSATFTRRHTPEDGILRNKYQLINFHATQRECPIAGSITARINHSKPADLPPVPEFQSRFFYLVNGNRHSALGVRNAMNFERSVWLGSGSEYSRALL
jgi:hypothetical protein